MSRGSPSRNKLSVRFVVATIDQGIASISNFAVGVAVARVAGLGAFGAYSLVYAGWIILAGFHRSLITDPMNIENDIHAGAAARNIRLNLSSEMFLGVAGGAVSLATGLVLLVAHQHQYGLCFVTIAPFLPFLLAQDYWRWVGFMKGQPQKALSNDIVFVVIQVLVFVNLVGFGIHTALVAIVAWGFGAVAGAVYGLWQHGTVPSLRGGLKRLRDRWYFSKWLLGANIVQSATSQATLVLSAAFLGPGGIGGLKSALTLVLGPSMVIIQASGSVGLPEATKQLATHGWPGLRRVQRWTTAIGAVTVGIVLIVVLLAGRHLLIFVYGQEFGRFATAADIVAVSLFISTFALGPILSLKATRQTRLQVPISATSLVATVMAIVNLAPTFGVAGAAWANLIGNVTRTGGLLIVHWKTSRRTAEALVPNPPPPPDRSRVRSKVPFVRDPRLAAADGPLASLISTKDAQRDAGAALHRYP